MKNGFPVTVGGAVEKEWEQGEMGVGGGRGQKRKKDLYYFCQHTRADIECIPVVSVMIKVKHISKRAKTSLSLADKYV